MNINSLHAWFLHHRRSFPWRQVRSPYAILVSELMLQQTQAERVVEYFSRWLRLFPDITTLALASETAITKAWEGLGYYARARALHTTAQLIVSQYGGQIPEEEHVLRSLPGIGPYTAGAIRAFAFHKRAAAVDTNVLRVISRVQGKMLSKKEAEAFLYRHLPEKSPWTIMEAIIELGALLCKRFPTCMSCPISSCCQAYKNGAAHTIPPPSKHTIQPLWRDVIICIDHNFVLLTQNKKRGVMKGLYEFPYIETTKGGTSIDTLQTKLSAFCNQHITSITQLPSAGHSFTHFRATLYPTLFATDHSFTWPESEWVELNTLGSLPFSSGHRRVADSVIRYCSANLARL